MNQSVSGRGWSTPEIIPLAEVNSDLVGGSKKQVDLNQFNSNNLRNSLMGRHSKSDFESVEDLRVGTGLPPRPKKRKAMGMHR